jgi:predicted DCC family thiol-disulfide oxidoreductase YuxK
MSEEPDGLMLFDGVCRFCSTSVRLVGRFDRRGAVRFTPIQSPYGRLLAERHGLDPDDPTTFVFFEHGQARLRSDGAIAILKRLPAPWRWFAAARVLPRRWRDTGYDWLAAHRYRLFGRYDACMLPTEALAERFVTEPPGG